MMLGVNILDEKISLSRFGSLFAAFFFCVMTVGLAVSLSSAQTTGSATLRGTVKDPKGAVVPKAAVALVNEATKAERKTTTNDEGQYVFTALIPGNYTL